MQEKREEKLWKLTAIDVELAKAYYPVLVGLAKNKVPGTTFTYKDLISQAKQLFPDNVHVQNAIPVGTGRRLQALRRFTKEYDYPDLSSLVDGATEKIREYDEVIDVAAERERVYAFDWNSVDKDIAQYFSRFDLKLDETQGSKSLKIKNIRPRLEDVNKIRFEYWMANKSNYPKEMRGKAENIAELMMGGMSVEDAFQAALQDLIK